MEMKVCTKCKEPFPATNEYYHNRKASHDGLNPACKKCTNAVNAARFKATYKPKKNCDDFDDTIIYTAFKCRRCNRSTEYKYVDKRDIERLKNKFYCQQCKDLHSSDEELFYSQQYMDDVKASELPLMDSTGKPK